MASFAASVVSRAFWRELVPELGIEAAQSEGSVLAHTRGLETELRNGMLTDGYFQRDALVPAAQTAPMAELLARLSRAEVPLCFAFVFDAFWQVGSWFRPILTT